MSRYRLVHFTPSSAEPKRFPLGALVETKAGTEFIRARDLPGADSIGAHRFEVCRMALQVLSSATAFDVLPRSLNSLASLGEPALVPSDDPITWVAERISSKPSAHGSTRS